MISLNTSPTYRLRAGEYFVFVEPEFVRVLARFFLDIVGS
jgi:hypothetical protein